MWNLAFSATVAVLLFLILVDLRGLPNSSSSTATILNETRQQLCVTPEDKQLEFLGRVRTLLGQHPGSVTSWIRSPARNKAVGGAKNSKHLTGLAVDVVLDNPNEGLAQICKTLHLRCLDEGDHVHVETK